MILIKFIALTLLLACSSFAQDLSVVRINYPGGGDWYGNKTMWLNVFSKIKNNLGIAAADREVSLKVLDPQFKLHPFAYISGHGNINFTEEEIYALRTYLIAGGFLFADDDYGMDKSFRKQMKRVFPELNFTELPFSHPIYQNVYNFPNGLPKIHEHEGGPPKGLALIYEGRIVCFYSYNTDISDGCEDPEIHNDPPEKREQALQMAVNIFLYPLIN
jgi:hypothetical protein